MIPDSIEKDDMSEKFKDRHHAGHWYYESKKGKVSLALWDRTVDYYYKAGPYEIYSWENLFEDVEFYPTMEEAEKRITEVLT